MTLELGIAAEIRESYCNEFAGDSNFSELYLISEASRRGKIFDNWVAALKAESYKEGRRDGALFGELDEFDPR